ncbi:MAG: HAD-IC family P-type ATPase [Candidatus Kaiserbacteria bacterium]|nr:HAD-IC family P-type ATPase [Candidatus Kaiserbacteria bacterium]
MMLGKSTTEIQKQSFWSLSESEVAGLLETDVQHGLSKKEADKRLEIFGENIIENTKITPAFYILLNQFKSPLILMLVFAGFVTIFIGHIRDAIFIFSAVIVNSALGFYQEYKAEKAISELRTYLKQRSRVIRDGRDSEIDAVHLVPGDVMRLSQGDRVPADGRLIYANDIQIDEAVLTGESLPVVKSTEAVSPEAILADQKSMIFAGTMVTQGVATAIVCRTDFATELGKIAELVADSQREETPLQGAIRRFSIRAGMYLAILTLVIFVGGILLGHSRVDMFLLSVAIAVSAVPEGLPVAMTVILAIGVQRMARRKGVVRKLVAAEALGSTTVILTDKTGTLTMAKMELSKVLPIARKEERGLLEMALINTNVVIENQHETPSEWRMSGRTLEAAIVRAAALRGISTSDIKNSTTILSTLPFNAANKFSASLILKDGKHTLLFFGAPDIFINHSTLRREERNGVHASIDALAQSGELVVGVATKIIDKKEDFDFSKELELEELIFEGLITLRDPVRPSVKKAIQDVESSGIRVVVMTGDHRGTALAIAKEVGLKVDSHGVLDAAELRMLGDEDLKKRLPALGVISRVSPLDKLRIVKAFQEAGEVVAMTGDGVNDAPSIKRADIGIAMGSGTEVTRDVADLVLLDDNFETIAAAVEEGRQIMNNIRKVLVYLLSSVADALILIGGSIVMGIALPMNALQILWVNFFSDSFPAIAFAFEKDGGGSIVHRRNNAVVLFNPLMKFLIIFIGLSTSAFLFVLYWLLLKAGFQEGIVRTFIFASFGSYSLFLAFSVRSLDISIFKYPFFSNHFLILGVAIGFILMGAAVYVPFLQELFGTVSLPTPWLLGVVGVGVLNIVLIELGKWFFRRKRQSGQGEYAS